MRSLQEIATTLRTVADIRQLMIDAPSASISIAGTASDITPAVWLSAQMDTPARGEGTTLPSQKATFGDYVYLVYYVKHSRDVAGIQEIITNVRVVEQLQKIYDYTAGAAIAIRGTPTEVEMAEWLMQQLDVPAGSPPPGTHAYSIPGQYNDTLRVFFLPAATPTRSMQEIVTGVRTTGQIMRVYMYTKSRAIAVNAPAAQVETAARIINGWQTP